MKSQNFTLTRYDADDGYVFVCAEPIYLDDEDGNKVQEHLYAKTLFIGYTDSIDNYIEVPTPVEE